MDGMERLRKLAGTASLAVYSRPGYIRKKAPGTARDRPGLRQTVRERPPAPP